MCELTSPCGSNSPSFEVLRPQRINQRCETRSLQHPLIISSPSLPLALPEIAFKVSRTPCYRTGQELLCSAPAQSCSPTGSRSAASPTALCSPTCALFLGLSFPGFSSQLLALFYSSLHQTENLFITCWFLPWRCLRAVIEPSILWA